MSTDTASFEDALDGLDLEFLVTTAPTYNDCVSFRLFRMI